MNISVFNDKINTVFSDDLETKIDSFTIVYFQEF